MTRSHLTVIGVMCIAGSAWADDWSKVDVIDGVTIESRPMAGSSFDELRLTCRSALTPERLCLAVWGEGNTQKPEEGFKLRRVLKQTEDERWTYEQIDVAVVSDRDYTIHAKRSVESTAHLCQVQFETRNSDGPPPQPGFVRIPRIEGSWTLEPDVGGGTLITYVIYSEPGGSVPAWLARSGQRKSAVTWMQRILARAGHT